MPNLPGAADEPYDRCFAKWMIKNKGLVAIPVSIFFSRPHQKDFDHYIRFCFVKVRESGGRSLGLASHWVG